MAVGGGGGRPANETLQIDMDATQCPTDGHSSGGPGGYVPSGSTGATAVREQINAVKKELDFIFKEICGPGGRVQGIDLQEVEKVVKHLEVDRDELSQRCSRLLEEKKGLLEVNAHMESELYAKKTELEEAQRKLRHQELDIQRLQSGGLAPEPLPQASSQDDEVVQESLEALQTLKMNNAAGPSAAMRQASKMDLFRALRISQDELAAEKARCEKLEKKLRKDRQRLQLLEDAAERQRLEILAIRQKKQQRVAAQPELAGKTKVLHHLAHTAPVHREIKPGPSPFGGGSQEDSAEDSPMASSGEHGLTRSSSAPTKLPKMKVHR
eukprot:gb/GFBE01014841.1/.p1 GENE.gb/GFBE01014841.1/~~gb/GFBE01014841.1/.p1  ORF type:complete len:325 (+),score=88.65 gb/GFBE01014841.1/:1-975(+)